MKKSKKVGPTPSSLALAVICSNLQHEEKIVKFIINKAGFELVTKKEFILSAEDAKFLFDHGLLKILPEKETLRVMIVVVKHPLNELMKLEMGKVPRTSSSVYLLRETARSPVLKKRLRTKLKKREKVFLSSKTAKSAVTEINYLFPDLFPE